MRNIFISKIFQYADSYDIARDINRALTKVVEEFKSKISKTIDNEYENLQKN